MYTLKSQSFEASVSSEEINELVRYLDSSYVDIYEEGLHVAFLGANRRLVCQDCGLPWAPGHECPEEDEDDSDE